MPININEIEKEIENGRITFNEVRKEYGLGPIEDCEFDKLITKMEM